MEEGHEFGSLSLGLYKSLMRGLQGLPVLTFSNAVVSVPSCPVAAPAPSTYVSYHCSVIWAPFYTQDPALLPNLWSEEYLFLMHAKDKKLVSFFLQPPAPQQRFYKIVKITPVCFCSEKKTGLIMSPNLMIDGGGQGDEFHFFLRPEFPCLRDSLPLYLVCSM